MLSRKLVILFLIILFTVLQSTLLNYIQIFNAKPDILLILIIFSSFNYGPIYGLLTGALCGLFSEAASGVSTGTFVLAYSLGGLLIGQLSRRINPAFLSRSQPLAAQGRLRLDKQRIALEMGVSFIFSLAVYLFLFFIFRSSGADLPLFNALAGIIMPACFYTACVSPFVFSFLRAVFGILENHAA
jgi:hypothetical protein